MKIIIDSYIPYIQGALDHLAEVIYLPYKEITPEAVHDADALIVRTRTRCDEKLLKGSKVKFIASATIGYDHIDAEYCKKSGITWTNAPGCNALSVAQYMASVFSLLAEKNKTDLSTKTIGIVGVGAVGSKIAELAHSFGMRVLLNDPPRARREGSNQFVSLSTICDEADIITFHTLLNVSGEDTTLHLANRSFFNSLKKMPVIINAARGEIVDTGALLEAIENKKVSEIILDCWENEPDINRQLLSFTELATPHIAGYSADGKSNAATYSVQSLSRFFSLGIDHWKVADLPAPYPIDFSGLHDVKEFFLKTYDVKRDSDLLKNSPEGFEDQRSNYPFRREPKAYLNELDSSFRKKFEEQFNVFFR